MIIKEILNNIRTDQIDRIKSALKGANGVSKVKTFGPLKLKDIDLHDLQVCDSSVECSVSDRRTGQDYRIPLEYLPLAEMFVIHEWLYRKKVIKN